MVRVALIEAGKFGFMFLAEGSTIPALEIKQSPNFAPSGDSALVRIGDSGKPIVSIEASSEAFRNRPIGKGGPRP